MSRRGVNKMEKNEETVEDEGRIVEENGEIMVREEEKSAEEPELDPKGQSEEDNLETEETEEPNNSPGEESDNSEAKAKEPAESEGEPTKFKGKSRDDLVAMVESGTQSISKLSDENKNYRSKLKDIDVDPQEVKKKLSADDFRGQFQKEKNKLNYLDPDIETEDYEKQQTIVNQLESDWLEKRQDEILDRKLNDNENTVFIEKQKKKFQDDGIEVENFNELTDQAKEYAVNGRLNEGSYQKALIDKYGFEKVSSFYNIKAESKVRSDIKKATTNQDKRINVNESGRGVRSKLLNIDKMSPRDRANLLESLNPAELQKLVDLREEKGIM